MSCWKTGLTALLLACGMSSAGARREVPTPLPPDDAFTRAMAVMARFDYTVLTADRQAGYVRAEHKASSLGTEALTGASYIWRLTITVVEDADGVRYVVQPENVKDTQGRQSTTGMRIMGAQQAEVDSLVALLEAPASPERRRQRVKPPADGRGGPWGTAESLGRAS